MDWYKMGIVYGKYIRKCNLTGSENTKAMVDMITACTSNGSQSTHDIHTFIDAFIHTLETSEIVEDN